MLTLLVLVSCSHEPVSGTSASAAMSAQSVPTLPPSVSQRSVAMPPTAGGSADVAAKEARDVAEPYRPEDSAKAPLLTKLRHGRASADDARMLRALCESRRDDACLAELVRAGFQ